MNAIIQETIKNTLNEFMDKEWDSKSFLTEDDLRCHLFYKLQDSLSDYQHEASVHAEVRWYGDKRNKDARKLKFRSDIVIINNSNLIDNNSPSFNLPSKGYGFDKYHAIVEVKLRRPNDKSSDTWYRINQIEKDIKRLKEIKSKTDYSHKRKYYLIIFDKKRKRKLFYDYDNINMNWLEWYFG